MKGGDMGEGILFSIMKGCLLLFVIVSIVTICAVAAIKFYLPHYG